jgi:hypothetical protein
MPSIVCPQISDSFYNFVRISVHRDVPVPRKPLPTVVAAVADREEDAVCDEDQAEEDKGHQAKEDKGEDIKVDKGEQAEVGNASYEELVGEEGCLSGIECRFNCIVLSFYYGKTTSFNCICCRFFKIPFFTFLPPQKIKQLSIFGSCPPVV